MSKNCNCEFLHDIDMFGKDPEFYYKGRNKRTTLVGRICSILFVAVYIAFFIYKLVQMIKRVDVTFYDTFAFTGETPSIKLSSDNFYGGFGIMSPFTEDTFVDERYYFAKATFWEGKKVNGRWVWKDTNIPLEKCKLEKFGAKYQEIFAEKNLENLYCLSHVDVTLEGYSTSESYNYFEVKRISNENNKEENEEGKKNKEKKTFNQQSIQFVRNINFGIQSKNLYIPEDEDKDEKEADEQVIEEDELMDDISDNEEENENKHDMEQIDEENEEKNENYQENDEEGEGEAVGEEIEDNGNEEYDEVEMVIEDKIIEENNPNEEEEINENES